MKTPWIVGLTLVVGCGSIAVDDPIDGSRGTNDGATGTGASGASNNGGRGNDASADSSGGAGGAPSNDAGNTTNDAMADISITDGGASADASRSDVSIGIDVPSFVDAPIVDTRSDIQTSVDVGSDGRGTGGSGGTGGATGGTAGTGGTGGSSGSGGTGGTTGGTGGTGGATGGTGGATGGTGGMGGATGGTGGAVDAGCSETPQQFCSRLGKTCEDVTATSCGASRTVNCGTCTGVMGCVQNVCQTPVCQWTSYTGSIDQRFSRGNIYDAVVAASTNAQSLLLQASVAACDPPNYLLYDETATAGVYGTPLDITTWWNNNALAWAALTSDGLGIITLGTNKTIAKATRGALNIAFSSTPSPTQFATINAGVASISGASIGGLAISSDGLEFYYSIYNTATVADGVYRSVRTSASAVFPNGSRVQEIAAEYDSVSAISSDGLTLFMNKGYSGAIFTRGSTTGQFVYAAAVTGWHLKPGHDCVLFGTGSSGGCAAQDIFVFTHP